MSASTNSSGKVNWLFVDLNSYFASVEQQLDPKLRGKPVAVVPMMADNTSVIAASYEAKKFGVKTGTRVRDARMLCPGIKLIEAQHEAYVHYHEAIVEAVESCLPVTSVMSIDEMACRLTGSDREPAKARLLGQAVKNRILKVGDQLWSSVGLAPNRLLAKVGSDMQKPDGLTTILLEDLPQILFKLKLRDFPGIGRAMEIRLAKFGIHTTEQMFALKIHEMRAIWGGVCGDRFYLWLRGEDLEYESEENKSVGHSHVLPPEYRNFEKARSVGQKLLHKAAARLRKIGCWTSAMTLSISYLDETHWSKEARMLECQDTLTLLEIFDELWKESPDHNKPIKVSITLRKLIADSDRTFSFFENEKRNLLTHAMDSLNAKYGKNTVYFAGIHEVKTSAPTRIAFSNIPDFSE